MAIQKTAFLLIVIILAACNSNVQNEEQAMEMDKSIVPVSDFWKNANVYFLLTDRFNNGDKSNDLQFGRTEKTATLRGFEGGDLKGITAKIKEGYFNNLGVDAIWMTPIVEQVHNSTDEGTGNTYAYHGYWAKDWTALDPNFGTEADFEEFVETARQHRIKVLFDVVINHTGPVTPSDPQWPDEWVRTTPTCQYADFESTVECTLVENLPDIRTEGTEAVELPKFLKDKWKAEGRLDEEMKSLDAFFERTGYPRTPRNYIIKWFRDWVRKYGIDGFRIDTAKHTEADLWLELKKECADAFEEWSKENPHKRWDDEKFYMVGEVYGFGAGAERAYSYGTEKVDFYENGFESLINFAFKSHAKAGYEELFNSYSAALNGGPLDGVSILNYVSSHDDSHPFDAERLRAFEAGTKLMLCPGGVQMYYGDELARPLIIEGTNGDATLRSFMNWKDLEQNDSTRLLLTHWQKLGQFRKAHRSVGAGIHQKLQDEPYLFKRTLNDDKVIVGLDLEAGKKIIPVSDVFADGTKLKDYYSRQGVTVKDGKVIIDSEWSIVLLGQ